jgi:colanic acid biosynthesis glycosyl transferase WcaI
MARQSKIAAAEYLLLVNQVVGPLFSDLVVAASRRAPVLLFRGVQYRRSPLAARFLTWAAFSIQLAWYLLWKGHDCRRLLVVSNPPFAPLIAPLARQPYALLLYDLYPQVLHQIKPRHFLLRQAFNLAICLWQAANRSVYDRAERIFTLSDAMATELRSVMSSDDLWIEKVRVIPPWASASLHPAPAEGMAFRKYHQLDLDRLLITYSGNLGITHPLEPLLDAVGMLQSFSSAIPVQLLLIGGGPKRIALEHHAAQLGLQLSDVRFLDPLPFAALSGSLSASDLAVVAIDGPAAVASLPSKTFSAIACGTPLLAIAPLDSALAQLVRQDRCGFVVEPGPKAAAEICSLLSTLSADPRRLSELAANSLAASRRYTPANAESLLDAWLCDHMVKS